jgi:hypothetical protein
VKRSADCRRGLVLFGALFVALSTLSSGARLRASAQPPPDQAGASAISPEALAQIEALIREKESRTGVEQKIDSQLIYELKMQEGRAIASGIQTLETDIPYADDGHAVVDVKARLTSELTARLNALGAEVLSSTPDGSGLRIHLDGDQVPVLAASPDVVFIQPKQGAMTSRLDITTDGRPGTRDEWLRRRAGRVQNAAAVTAYLDGALNGRGRTSAITGQGSQSSQGDVTHRAFAARGTFHADGTGVKIGVLSDGVTNLAYSQALGDLGIVTVLPRQAGSGDEGTAMLEIIHDLAPGAQLYFATAASSISSYAQNIRDLRTEGCDIIVDDYFYFVETPFQDGQASSVISNTNGGVVIQAVKDVTASGALYFSSAGNSGNLDDGTSGVWEGNFVDGGAVAAPLISIPSTPDREGAAARLHNFGGQTFNVLNAVGIVNNLFWSDPLGGSSNDYDLFRLNAAGTEVKAASLNIQDGTQDPYESVSAGAAGARLVVVKYSGAGRFLHLNTTRGRLSIPTAGQTHGHAATSAAAAFGVAATPAGAAFPNAFSSTNSVETFSSDGPRRIFFHADGTPITPGDFSSTGGQVLTKPDITAADGVSVTGVGSFPTPFFGTSAAAPHAAAIAALVKSANLTLTPAQIRTALEASAIDIGAPGIDRDSGVGIVMAYGALQSSGAVGTAFLNAGDLDIVPAEHPGDGNGRLDAGEGAQVAVTLRNLGVVSATGITAMLKSSTPGITVTIPDRSTYPDIAASIGTGKNDTPLLFTIASDLCAALANFTLEITYNGGPSPRLLSFQLPIGPPPITITSTLDKTPPQPGPAYTATTGAQHARVLRDGIASTCGFAKPFPGTSGEGTRRFDAYAFNTCDNSAPSCIEVALATRGSAALFASAYSPTFDPANLATNYRADAGASQLGGGFATFSFLMDPGPQTFVVDVNEVIQNVGSTYDLKVSGACFAPCVVPNHVPVAKARNVTVFADSSCGASASIDDGSSDADGDPLTITQSPAGPYPLGTTYVLLTVTDPKGATSQATGTVTVLDNTPPSIVCPASIVTATAPGKCQAPVTFALPTASDSCSTPVSVTTNPAPGSPFSLGTTSVLGTATDTAGNSATCPFNVTVVDNEPPSVSSFSLSAPPLWPPNHRMVDVTVDYALFDNCDAASCVLSVSSNEPENGLGDGDTDHDWEIVDARHVRVRAERSGNGNGRIYTVTLTCTDAVGNKTVRTGTLTVRTAAD